LGVPFVLCALLIDQLKDAFTFIKRHYGVINKICGAFLVIVGILMMLGMMARLSAMLA
jgi:cytochrome c-type biogenesis protein